MSDNFISNNNNFISNNNNNRGRRRNFQGSLPSTNYQMPENFAQKDIQFPKAPSLGQFTPSNSGIKRDWSGSEMQVPEFKGLNAVGKGLQGKAKDKRAKQIQDEKDKKPMKVTIVEGEEDNPAPRTRKDGSPIKPFGDFGLDGDDDSGSPSSTRKGKTSYNEDGELEINAEGKWTMGDTARSAKELFKWGKQANSDRKARKGQKDREAPATPDFDDGGVFD
jgi:hypothetical protein